MVSRFKPRGKKPVRRKGYLKYLKRKHDYTKCTWCNRVIRKDSNFCCWCGTKTTSLGGEASEKL